MEFLHIHAVIWGLWNCQGPLQTPGALCSVPFSAVPVNCSCLACPELSAPSHLSVCGALPGCRFLYHGWELSGGSELGLPEAWIHSEFWGPLSFAV